MSIKKPVETSDALNEAARGRLLSVRGEPLFLADWLRAVFIHYEIPADELQRDVPFQLDLREGKAYVSFVAFAMRGMRPRLGGPLAAWFLKPVSTNDFLNVRTYVRHRGEPGIYFLTEWMNNRFSLRLGPLTFGLPYRSGDLNYQHRHELGSLSGIVREKIDGPSLTYEAKLNEREFVPCSTGSLDEFLLERYTAFTSHGTTHRFFRIWHPVWEQKQTEVFITDDRLMKNTWPWFAKARLLRGNYSPGARDVWMGRPQRSSH